MSIGVQTSHHDSEFATISEASGSSKLCRPTPEEDHDVQQYGRGW